METKKQNQVNETEKQNQVANANEILKNVQANTTSLLKTSLGSNKASIYKKEIFNGVTDKQVKSLRKKFRGLTYNFLFSILNSDSKDNQKKLVDEFVKYYQQVYNLNDFSLASISSENTKDDKKQLLIQGLDIVKNYQK